MCIEVYFNYEVLLKFVIEWRTVIWKKNYVTLKYWAVLVFNYIFWFISKKLRHWGKYLKSSKLNFDRMNPALAITYGI